MAKRFKTLHLSSFCRDGIMGLDNYCIFVSNWIARAIFVNMRLNWKQPESEFIHPKEPIKLRQANYKENGDTHTMEKAGRDGIRAAFPTKIPLTILCPISSLAILHLLQLDMPSVHGLAL